MKVNEIKNPVSVIAGVGPQLSKTLAKLNIFTVGDLLSYYPKDYEDRSKRVSLKDYTGHGKVHTVAMVLRQEWFGYGRMKNLKVFINDGTATAELICFNRSFLENVLVPGTIISVTGQFFVKYNSLQCTSFDASKISAETISSILNIPLPDIVKLTPKDLISITPPDTGILPVYSLTEGLTQKKLHNVVKTALQQYAFGIENELADNLIVKHNLLSKQEALNYIHNPENLDQALLAKKTLAYEELFHFQLAIAQRAFKHRGYIPEIDLSSNLTQNQTKEISPEEFEISLSPTQKKLLERIPFELTADQRNVVFQMNQEIDKGYKQRYDLLKKLEENNLEVTNEYKPPFTMARLLQGDVGSGKTLTALFVCLRIKDYGGQCALMAPTEILAHQHADTTAKMLDCLGVRTAFLTGNVKSSGRTQLLKALKNGDIDIVIGTHALFSTQVAYKDLQLAVIDEQHRFGVLQRQAILAKGRVSEKNGITFEPHLLMMSATPIPQTLALTVFGDLDVSIIKTMPQGRKPIKTYLIKEGNEINAYEAVRKELEKGHQAYFVYPAIDNEFDESQTIGTEQNVGISGNAEISSKHKLKSAEKNFEKLSKQIFPQYKCALVHSKVPEEDQNQILEDFHDNKIQVLAATTVIEVGVDVPNATCMVIEQADHFGMAQLHQLRGRVGRGDQQSICCLIYSKNITQTGIERMKALRESTDGFYIAEQDLKTRGPGEMTGTLQAGALELGIADIVRDKDLLYQARTDAFNYLKSISPIV